jgi:surface protein
VFNQNLDKWDVSKVTDMSYMFGHADAFNQPLDSWNVSSVIDMTDMFRDAKNFNQSLNRWNVSKVTNMRQLFFNASSFNQPLADWDVSNVTNMADVFQNARSFNQPLSNWDVSKVTNMSYMFNGAVKFNQDLSIWEVSKATEMISMFQDATKFNQDMSSWDVSKVTQMISMFHNASGFRNHDLSSWDVGSVRKDKNLKFMENAGSGNTPPRWLPNDIIQNATVTFTNISWYEGTDESNRNCLKYRTTCASHSEYSAHITGGANQSISFKFDKSYRKGRFEYHNRRGIAPDTTIRKRIMGSSVKFLLKNVQKGEYIIGSDAPESFSDINVEFDEVVLEFYGKNPQGWRNITLSAQPYD